MPLPPRSRLRERVDAVEALEDALEFVGVEAVAGVRDGEHDVAARRGARRERDAAAGRGVAQRVVEQVREHLARCGRGRRRPPARRRSTSDAASVDALRVEARARPRRRRRAAARRGRRAHGEVELALLGARDRARCPRSRRRSRAVSAAQDLHVAGVAADDAVGEPLEVARRSWPAGCAARARRRRAAAGGVPRRTRAARPSR